MRKISTLYPLCALLAMLPLVSCGGSDTSPNGWPKLIRISISIAQENPEQEGSRLNQVAEYIQKKMGLPTEITGSSGYGVTIEAMRAKKIEICTLGPFGYVIASEKAGAEVIAMRSDREGKAGLYAGTLGVAAESPLRSIEDMQAKAKSLTLSFVDPASSSGYLVQRAFLESNGVKVEESFKRVVFSSNHMASILTLLAGKADVAAFGSTQLPSLIADGRLKEGQVRVLWTSENIPDGPVAVRKDLPEAFKKKLQAAFLSMADEAPDTYLNMAAKIYRTRYKGTKFIAADDTMFDPLRKMARNIPAASLLEH